MEKVELSAEIREKVGKGASTAVRRGGKLPAVVYGRGVSPLAIGIDAKDFLKMIGGHAGRNVIIEMKINNNGEVSELPVMVKDLQRDPLSSQVLHVDFLRIELKKEIRTKVPVSLVGEAVGVREDGGVLVHGIREVEVKCLPTSIPDKLTVDVSLLRIGDSIHVSQLVVPQGVVIVAPSMGETLMTVAPPAKVEVEVAPAVPAAEVPASEVSPEVAAEGASPAAEKAEELLKEKGKEKSKEKK